MYSYLHYHVHKSPPFDPLLQNTNELPHFVTYSLKIPFRHNILLQATIKISMCFLPYTETKKLYNPLPLITLHGMHSFLRSKQSYKFSWSKNFPTCNGTDDPFLPCPQEPDTYPYSESEGSNLHLSTTVLRHPF